MKVSFKKTVAATVLAGVSSASFAYGEPPISWTEIIGASTANVKFYKKNGSEVYAQVVNMAGGAKVELKQTKVGTLNGFNTYSRSSIETWYTGSANPVSVVNGDFFNQNISPTTLSFAVRANGVLVEPGGDPNANKRQIEFFTGQGAFVTTASAWRIANGTTAQNAMGGHAPVDAPSAAANRGRTTLCTLSPSSPSPLFLILVHGSALQSQVNTDLANWKCNAGSEIVMDGSASSQLAYKVNGVVTYFKGTNDGTLPGVGRTVPQVIVIRNN